MLHKPANKMRNSGFVIPVIRCLSKVCQEAWRALLNLCVITGISADCVKQYVRIAIPKNSSEFLGMAFRHLAIGFDFHCKQMEIYHSRIMIFFKSHADGFLPSQITAFMPGRGAPDSNMMRRVLKEDSEQTARMIPGFEFGSIHIDLQKCYDSITADFKQLALLAIDAPVMFQIVLA